MSNKTVSIVTGGSRGIGKSIAKRLATQGPVLIVGTNKHSLATCCTELSAATGGTVDFIAGDVADENTATLAIEAINNKNWTYDTLNLVCSAGIGKSGLSANFAPSDWRRCFEVNVNGAFWFCQAVLPLMQQRKKGNICLISSIAGIKGYKYQAAYTASKHALVGLAKSLALEYGKHGIIIVPICPAFVDTDMTQQTITGLVKHRGLTEVEARKIIENVSPQKRIIDPDEVAALVQTVCSGLVPSLNGHPIIMSGGE